MQGLIIEGFDRDPSNDDALGSTTTDSDGRYQLPFKAEDFGQKADGSPELYVRVRDAKGRLLYDGKDSITFGQGGVNTIDIDLPESTSKEGPEPERANFKKLIATNPNYFGNLTELELPEIDLPEVKPQQGNTSYEELQCIGLWPERNELEAIFEVKLPYGFGGGLCTNGSKEYVAFYIDWQDGAGFQPTGPAVTLNTHDLAAAGEKSICYAVRQEFDPKQLKCSKPYIVRLRAILSWEQAPLGPGFTPVWGNVVEGWIQIAPLPHPNYQPALSLSTSKSQFQLNYRSLEEASSALELLKAGHQAQQEVPEERSKYALMATENPNVAGSISLSKDPKELANTIKNLNLKPNIETCLLYTSPSPRDA